MPNIIIAFFGAMLLSYVLTPHVIKLAHKIGAIDVPKDDRRVHSKPIPRLGGISIFGGFFLVSVNVLPLTREMFGFFHYLIKSKRCFVSSYKKSASV